MSCCISSKISQNHQILNLKVARVVIDVLLSESWNFWTHLAKNQSILSLVCVLMVSDGFLGIMRKVMKARPRCAQKGHLWTFIPVLTVRGGGWEWCPKMPHNLTLRGAALTNFGLLSRSCSDTGRHGALKENGKRFNADIYMIYRWGAVTTHVGRPKDTNWIDVDTIWMEWKKRLDFSFFFGDRITESILSMLGY